ncbi:hypothetical protein IV203_014702 [Nitzschia inconspicua]|uniref:Uncharacterized protein n=1 Tax=Nitzschia inconspicua TaxID=303405 RepID=A0A9K3L966_9STRA|nr:hypothetical protein IV203_014702 [Nitzschia inconspicua]
MRAAKMTYIPNIILEDNNRRLSIDCESRASPRVSSLLLSASLQSSGTDDGRVQRCWEETKGFLDKHDQSQMFGDPSDGWIMYDDYYNNILEQLTKHRMAKEQYL